MGSGHKDHMNQAFGTDNSQSDAMDVGSNSSTFSQSVYTRSDFTNAPLKQTGSGVGFCRRMPCKARGVPGEHVASNAYIDIPVDAKHGTLLSCSHPSCRHSGRLFRFCSVCQVPVAKRNFARRHAHGLSLTQINDSTSSTLSGPTQDSLSLEGGGGVAALPNLVMSIHNRYPDNNNSTASDGGPIDRSLLIQDHRLGATNPGNQQRMTDAACRNAFPLGSANVLTITNNNNKRTIDETKVMVQITEEELDWLYLFRQRPGPNESKVAWLNLVEQVGGIPLGENQTKRINRRVAEGVEQDDDELSEIETSKDGLANVDTSYMEDLFE